jgi:uncharacterized membrane protein YjgN (DUF898 family)
MDGSSPQMDQAPALRALPLEFRATGGEYFRIWIVNLLLTILTLGIYSAWAKVRRLRYFYGSTALAGSSFEYHARPVAILRGRLIVVGVYALFAGATYVWPLAQLALIPIAIFGVPWIIMRSRLFQMRMTSWRGLRFNFSGGYGGAFASFVGWTLLSLLTLLLLWPYALWKQVKYIATNTSFGTQRFGFDTRPGRFYRLCLATVGVLLLAGVAAFIGTLLAGFLAGSVVGLPRAPIEAGNRPLFVVITTALSALCFLLAALVAGAYYRARFLNASIGGVTAGPHRLQSRLQARPLMGIMLTNLLLMVVTLGLYYPWAQVRLLRYQLENTSVLAADDLDQFVADARAGAGALGEEAGDFFDVDFGI